ncbi:uncharacterized protein [Watersipora subatra]|uniref:uncharacterized protein n=1 Tax=Watersipora subatra TaxID=2589382 RepID=UPI00355B5F65
MMKLAISFILVVVMTKHACSTRTVLEYFQTNPAAHGDVQIVSKVIDNWITQPQQMGLLMLFRSSTSCSELLSLSETEGAEFLAALSNKFDRCLTMYSLLPSTERDTASRANAKLICEMGGYHLCDENRAYILKEQQPTCRETGLTKALQSLMTFNNYYKCLI